MHTSTYYNPMPSELTAKQMMSYGADVVVRDIGYIPVVGISVGVPRLITGIWQKIMGGEGSLQFSAEDGKVYFRGSRQAGDGVANIVRGCFECIPLANLLVLPLWDYAHDDRWFLIPCYSCK